MRSSVRIMLLQGRDKGVKLHVIYISYYYINSRKKNDISRDTPYVVF